MKILFDFDDVLYFTRFELYAYKIQLFNKPDDLLNRFNVYNTEDDDLLNNLYKFPELNRYRYKNKDKYLINQMIDIMYIANANKKFKIYIICNNPEQLSVIAFITGMSTNYEIIITTDDKYNECVQNLDWDIYYCSNRERLDYLEKNINNRIIVYPNYGWFDDNKILTYSHNKYEKILILGGS